MLVKRIDACLACLVRAIFITYLFAALVGLLIALWRLLRACIGGRRAQPRPVESSPVPEWAFREPDPLIYSQPWLQAHGLAYTWDNPDIRLELPSAPGVPVDVHALSPGTVYRVRARIWNGSPTAPVAQLPVEMAYLDFGIGGVAVAIGSTTVDLPVKGAAGTPAYATVDWKTPTTPGHYCIQVRLVWPHDADPGNNLGQHNVDVKPLNSPRAGFTVPVRNTGRRPMRVALAVDAYELPLLRPCPPEERGNDGEAEARRRRRRVAVAHGAGTHPVPEGWTVDLGQATEGFDLEPGQVQEVAVVITAPDGFSGRKAFNLNGLAGRDLVGGVTLIVTGDGS
jgi:hypothetical protein